MIHTFANRWWGSVSAGYSFGGESEINGVSKDDERGDLLTAISFGLPVGETQAVKLVYLRGDTQERVGSDTNSLMVSWSPAALTARDAERRLAPPQGVQTSPRRSPFMAPSKTSPSSS